MITASKLIAASAFLDSPVIKIEKMCIKIATTVSTTATASTTGQKRDLGIINSEIIVGPVDPVDPPGPPGPPPPTSPADIGWFNSNTYHS